MYEGGAREKAGMVSRGWITECLSRGDCILQGRREAAVGVEGRERQVIIGDREIQLWTWATWMGGAFRVTLGSCSGFCAT